MHKLQFYLLFLLLLATLNASATRSMYVDNFENILGDISAENNLLNYAQVNGIETLLLYGLHIVHANHDLPNPVTNVVLANFIRKAKTSYGVLSIGATAENGDFFTNVIDAYNNSRSDPLEKFDIYNLEFEYWISSTTGPGGYYCTTYLTPNALPCNENGAFQFYVSILETMNSLADNNIHAITTEAYVGWPTTGQADTIGANLDRLRLHAYVNDPNTAFNYSENRLIDFANGTPNLDVSVIFSSEPSFMQTWLENNSMIAAENIYTSDWMNGSSGWSNNVNLEGFTYFTYTDMVNIVLPVEMSYFNGQFLDQGVRLRWETLSETAFDHFELERKNTSTNLFDHLGVIKGSGNISLANQYQFIDNNPNLGLNYYRLKLVDYDGQYQYSQVIAVDNQKQNKAIKIYPSFAKDYLFIKSPEEIHQITIYDAYGRKVKGRKNFELIDVLQVNVKELMPGPYLITVKSIRNIKIFRFIKSQ